MNGVMPIATCLSSDLPNPSSLLSHHTDYSFLHPNKSNAQICMKFLTISPRLALADCEQSPIALAHPHSTNIAYPLPQTCCIEAKLFSNFKLIEVADWRSSGRQGMGGWARAVTEHSQQWRREWRGQGSRYYGCSSNRACPVWIRWLCWGTSTR